MRRLILFAMVMFLAALCVAQEKMTLDHPVRRIAGVVQKADGSPVPNIDVEVFGGRSLVANTKTDSHGKFAADRLEPGEYEVWFTYKPHPVFKDVVYRVTIDAKGSKEAMVVKLETLSQWGAIHNPESRLDAGFGEVVIPLRLLRDRGRDSLSFQEKRTEQGNMPSGRGLVPRFFPRQ